MEEKIIQFIETEILIEQGVKIESQDDLLEDGLIDSLGVMRLITYLESEFGVKVPPQDMVIENFITVEAMVNYIDSK